MPFALNPPEALLVALAPDGLIDEFAEVDADAAEQAEIRTLCMGVAQHGQRLDRSLADLVIEFSRNYLQQLLVQGAVTLNGQVVSKASQRIKAGDQVCVEMRETLQSQAFRAEPMDIQVVHEDEHLLVLHKPAGLVVHPAPGNWSGTLLNGLLARDPRAALLPRAGIVHRLDKDTSGLMVVARSRQAMDALVRMIAERKVSRQYLALAHRPWKGATTRTVDAPIGRDPRNRLRMAVVDLSLYPGKLAKTDLHFLTGNDLGCLVKCTLHTGRTHQIRVHMALISHPLLADTLYGGSAVADMKRQALHAFRLAFVHPMTGQHLDLYAPLPLDMRQSLVAWGLSYNESQWTQGSAHCV